VTVKKSWARSCLKWEDQAKLIPRLIEQRDACSRDRDALFQNREEVFIACEELGERQVALVGDFSALREHADALQEKVDAQTTTLFIWGGVGFGVGVASAFAFVISVM